MQLALPNRIRATDVLNIYVNPLGQDIPTNGLQPSSGAFATPGYAVAWCAANLDAAYCPVTILVEGNTIYSSNPIPNNVGAISLDAVPGTMGCWTQNPIKICGSINNQPITGNPTTQWPAISMSGKAAVCAVGCSTVWQLEYLQLQSTIVDVEADRGSKLNVKNIVHGIIGNPYPTPVKYSAIYGGSIEILDQIWINSGGTNLWASLVNGIIVEANSPIPILAPGVKFTQTTLKDNTSNLAIPLNWPQ